MTIIVEPIVTLQQRLLQTNIGSQSASQADLRPLRSQLRSRYTKKCKTCHEILVKPESKAQSIDFPIKSIAYDKLPRFSIEMMKTSSSGSIILNLDVINSAKYTLHVQHSIKESGCVVDCASYDLKPFERRKKDIVQKLVITAPCNFKEVCSCLFLFVG